jgi:hypothetical protein
MDVGVWLRGLGLAQYEEKFRYNNIDNIDAVVLPQRARVSPVWRWRRCSKLSRPAARRLGSCARGRVGCPSNHDLGGWLTREWFPVRSPDYIQARPC